MYMAPRLLNMYNWAQYGKPSNQNLPQKIISAENGIYLGGAQPMFIPSSSKKQELINPPIRLSK